MHNMIVTLHWNDEAAKSLRPMLVDSGIQFEERELFLKGGPLAAGGATVVEILQAVSGLGVAGVLIAWVNAKASRYIHVTKIGNKIEVITKGMSVDDARRILESVKDISATEIPAKGEHNKENSADAKKRRD